jgi:hypothetical protein
MNRGWINLRSNQAGSEESHRLANALAEIADPEFLESVLQAKAALDRFGGQVFLVAKRDPLDPEGNVVTPDRGAWETWAYVFHYTEKLTAINAGAIEDNTLDRLPIDAQELIQKMVPHAENGDGESPPPEETAPAPEESDAAVSRE